MARIGDMLLQSGACTLEALHEALENQVLFGGRLGTNLLETGAVSEEHLAAALGAKYGVPWLAGDDLLCEKAAVALVPADIADRCNAVPYRLAGRKLSVCCIDPSALGALDEVAFVSGKQVAPVVVTETRLVHLLRAHYRVDRHLRAVAMRSGLLRPRAPSEESSARPRSRSWDAVSGKLVDDDGPAMLGAPSEEELEEATDRQAPPAPPSPPRAEPPPLELPSFTRDLLARLALDTGRPPAPPPPPVARVVAPPPEWPPDLQVALTAIATAHDRDAVLGLLLRHAAGRFYRVVLFALENGVARGMDGRAPGLRLDSLRTLLLPLEDPGIVAAAVLHGTPVDGPLAHVESDWKLVQGLGGGTPLRGLAVPVTADGRIVNVLYADRGPGGGHDRASAEDLAKVADAAGRRYDQLLGRS